MQDIADPQTLTALWARARAMFARAAEALGGAASIAAIAVLTQSARKQIAGWITRLEHTVRKLLFAEAARLADEPASAAPRSAPQLAQRRFQRARSELDLSRPETWPVRFSLAPPRIRRTGRNRWRSAEPPLKGAALRLARRFEALRRALDNPFAHARRLARIMRGLVRRFPEALMRYAMTLPRVSFFDGADPRLGVDCYGSAYNSVWTFNSS